MSHRPTVRGATERQAARRGPPGEPGTPDQVERREQAAQPGGDAWRDLRRNPIFWISPALIVAVRADGASPRAVHPGRPARLRPRRQPARAAERRPLVRLRHPGLRRLRPDRLRRPRLDRWSACCATLGRRRHRRWSSACSPATSAAGSTRCSPGSPTSSSASRSLLGGIVLLTRLSSHRQASASAVVLRAGAARLDRPPPGSSRSSVITAKQHDYVQAARALGAGNGRIMLRHILPNALAPVIVVLDHRARRVHRRRGDAVLPRRRPASRRPSPGASTSPTAPVHIRDAPAPAALPAGVPGPDRAGVHHARRRGPRRPRPEAAVRRP